MDSRGTRRSMPNQRSLLLTLSLTTLLSSFIVYILVGRHLKRFDDVAVALTERMQLQAASQASEMKDLMAALQTETKEMARSLRDMSELELERFRKVSHELRNHSRLVALAIGTQSELYSAQIGELATTIRDSTLGQSGMSVRQMQTVLLNQTAYTLASLRSQRRTEKDLVEVLRLVQDTGDNGGFKTSVERSLQDIVAAMERHTQIQQAAQQTLDALSGLLATQKVGGGAVSGTAAVAEQDKIHAVLKALVAHLRSEEKDNANALSSAQVVRRLESVLEQLRNQTSLSTLSHEVRLQTTAITRLRSQLVDFEAKVPTITDLGGVKKGEGEGAESAGRPEVQGAILSLLREVKKQTAQMQALQEKIEALEEETAGGAGTTGGQSVILTVLGEVRSQTKLMASLDARMGKLERKAGIAGEGGGGEEADGGQVAAGEAAGGEGEGGGGGGGQEGGEAKAGAAGGGEWLQGSEGSEPKVDVSEPGQWLQHQLAGSPMFMRFSGYRIAERKMVAVGLGTRAITESLNITACRWVGRESTVLGEVEMLFTSGNPSRKYEVVLLHCTFPSTVPSSGGYLSVSIDKIEYTLYREEIAEFAKLEPEPPFQRALTLCVAPMATPTEVRILREFVEFHRLMGVDHFVFYDAGGLGGPFQTHFMEELRAGTVELIPFKNVDKYDQEAHGELLASTDCAYASQYTSRWVAFLEANEYLYVKPPQSLRGLLEAKASQAWLTHGSIWWASQKCSEPANGTAEGDGDGFSIERMVFRWPFVLCHDTEKYHDRRLCLGETGNRKLIVDPRRVRRMQLHSPDPEDESTGVHMSTDEIVHLHYQRLLDGPLCSEVIPHNATVEWWYRNAEAQRFASSLRAGYHCNFTAHGCTAVLTSGAAEEDKEGEAGTQVEGQQAGSREGGEGSKSQATGEVEQAQAGQGGDGGGAGGGKTAEGEGAGEGEGDRAGEARGVEADQSAGDEKVDSRDDKPH